MSTRARVSHYALTLAAALGALCLVAAAACAVVGARPVVFQSGSMAPAVETGSLGLSRSVPTSDLRIGDVVTVPSGGGQVTHRVVDIERRGDRATLTLRGDANPAPDSMTYDVGEEVGVLVGSVPHLGRVVTWLTGPTGLLLLGGYAAWLVSVLLRRLGGGSGSDEDERTGGGHRRQPTRVLARTAAPVVALVLVGASPAHAAWTDDVPVGGASLSTLGTLPAPVLTCPLLGTARLDWDPVPGASGYLLYLAGDPVAKKVLTAAQTEQVLGDLALGSYYVRTYFGSQSWVSPASNSKTVTLSLLGVAVCL